MDIICDDQLLNLFEMLFKCMHCDIKLVHTGCDKLTDSKKRSGFLFFINYPSGSDMRQTIWEIFEVLWLLFLFK